MEELADGSFKGIYRFLSFIVRSLFWLIWDWCFEIIAWYIGWPICRILSFGRYPREAINDHEQAYTLTSVLVPLVGVGVLVTLAVGFARLGGGV